MAAISPFTVIINTKIRYLDHLSIRVYNSIVEYWSGMTYQSTSDRDLIILEHIEQNPDTTQAALASRLEVAVGTVNWHLKRLVEKGYIKVSRLERKKLKYIITSEGIALRARLTMDYIQSSFNLYRLVRERVISAIAELKAHGFHEVRIEGSGEVAEICHLTCLEHEITVVEDPLSPIFRLIGLKVILEIQEQ